MNNIDNIKLNPNGLREGSLSASIEGFKIVELTQTLIELSKTSNLSLEIEKTDQGLIKKVIHFCVKGIEKDLFIFQKSLTQYIQDYETRYNEKLTISKYPGLSESKINACFKSVVDTPLSIDVTQQMKLMANHLQLKINIENHKESLSGQKIHYTLSGLQTSINQFTENLNIYLEKKSLYKKKKIK
jgi:hypothetical protein